MLAISLINLVSNFIILFLTSKEFYIQKTLYALILKNIHDLIYQMFVVILWIVRLLSEWYVNYHQNYFISLRYSLTVRKDSGLYETIMIIYYYYYYYKSMIAYLYIDISIHTIFTIFFTNISYIYAYICKNIDFCYYYVWYVIVTYTYYNIYYIVRED